MVVHQKTSTNFGANVELNFWMSGNWARCTPNRYDIICILLSARGAHNSHTATLLDAMNGKGEALEAHVQVVEHSVCIYLYWSRGRVCITVESTHILAASTPSMGQQKRSIIVNRSSLFFRLLTTFWMRSVHLVVCRLWIRNIKNHKLYWTHLNRMPTVWLRAWWCFIHCTARPALTHTQSVSLCSRHFLI